MILLSACAQKNGQFQPTKSDSLVGTTDLKSANCLSVTYWTTQFSSLLPQVLHISHESCLQCSSVTQRVWTLPLFYLILFFPSQSEG